ncbi:hypothetical protein TMatcc_008611 [Talaromyces marneffei ATCC 18224]
MVSRPNTEYLLRLVTVKEIVGSLWILSSHSLFLSGIDYDRPQLFEDSLTTTLRTLPLISSRTTSALTAKVDRPYTPSIETVYWTTSRSALRSTVI